MEKYQNYTLKNVSKKFIDSIKKTVIKAGAVAQDGQEYSVSMWETDWQGFDLKDGTVVKAELRITEKNGYKNVNLYPERTNTLGPKTGGVGIKAAQERKEQMIEKAQDRKNDAIAFFNATNSAISLLKELSKDIPFTNDEDYKRLIRKWREFFLSEWRAYDAQDVTDKSNPF